MASIRQDLTLRNLRALKQRLTALDRRVQRLERISHSHRTADLRAALQRISRLEEKDA